MPRISACEFGRTFVHLNSRTAAQVVVAIRHKPFWEETLTKINQQKMNKIKIQ